MLLDCRFSRRSYRNAARATLAGALLLAASGLHAQELTPQFGRKAAVDKGPRALGLIQLSPKSKKGRLIPIAIMMDGKFFDAGSYKAAPVPMALDFETVYEGFRSGVSQGVFTITQPGQLNHVWIAEGTWLPAGEKAPEKSKKYATPVIEDKDAPPVLHRHRDADSDAAKDSEKDKDKSKDKDQDSHKDKDQDSNKGKDKPASQPPASTPVSSETTKAATATDETIGDPNRPRLRRGKPDASAHREPYATFGPLTDPDFAIPTNGKPDAKTPADTTPPQFVFIPAISDAGGADPRPYTYEVKPAEEAIYRSKMLDLAAAQLRGPASAAGKVGGSSTGKSGNRLVKPAFDNVSLRILDLSSSNEPVLVLSAKTRPPAGAGANQEPAEITLIARTNLEGDLMKLFFSQTDSHHLDVAPRLELIDAVDADGDGRGELLFRRTSDTGSAFGIYRVTSDRLWTLFEGTF